MAANQEIDALLQELGRLLALAPGGSEQVAGILERLLRQGYSPRLDINGGRTDRQVRPFCLDARDVAFLHSIGIDGTRKARRTRRP